ncbi:RDD family protein [Nonomuraea sp. SYSU D8015]|uniref:RDD family protein n=1 Tax=Nonomuraea sp. SYSU D8015 TaxID=2593644 RepID=UPI0016602CB7|nr:RDD family protein [Nonomuraea sp. SYSU D8015]
MTPIEVPPLASSNRRIVPIWTDGLLALGTGVVGGEVFGRTINYWIVAVGALLLVSFCNHVILTVLAGGSIGKLISGLRLIRTTDLGKPGVGQAIHRWLWGFFYILISPVLILSGSDVDHLDIAGLRIVRKADLR